jgi:dolichyl-phosphate-mannose--protein O-mannosyl transferase
VAFLLAIVALAGVLRVEGIERPDRRYFDERYYAADACLFVRSAPACGFEQGAVPSASEHPPLGVWIVAAGIETVGNRPLGWRLPSALFGTLTVALVYVLGRLLFRRRVAAAVAAVLLAVDPLHLVQSRIAMLDVFVVAFATAALALAVLDVRRPHVATRVAAGVAAGAAVATKWSGLLALVTVVVVEVVGASRRDRLSVGATVLAHWRSLAVAFAVVPAIVYVVSFTGRLDGQLVAAPWSADSVVRAFLGRQREMLDFHLGLDSVLPYSSPGWSWPLLKRPVVYWFDVDPDGRFREILAVGNPVTWWAGVAAVAAATVVAIRSRGRAFTATVVAVAALVAWAAWLPVATGRSFTFLYYFVAALPALYLAVGWVVDRVPRTVPAATAGAVLCVAALVFAVFLHPVATGRPLTPDQWRSRVLFTSCGDDLDERAARVRGPYRDVLRRAEGREIPVPGTGNPPAGWCWL